MGQGLQVQKQLQVLASAPFRGMDEEKERTALGASAKGPHSPVCGAHFVIAYSPSLLSFSTVGS